MPTSRTPTAASRPFLTFAALVLAAALQAGPSFAVSEFDCSRPADDTPVVFAAGDDRLELTRSDVGGAEARRDLTNESAEAAYTVRVAFCPDAAARLAEFTAQHIEQEMTLTADGETLVTAVLREPILGGSLAVAGGHDSDQATRILKALLGPSD